MAIMMTAGRLNRAVTCVPSASVMSAPLGADNCGGILIPMSCKNETDPPYQGAIYLTFDLPTDTEYFDQVAASLVSRGWRKGLPPNQYLYGTTLSKDGVTAILYRDPDHGGSGIMKMYGECRNLADHRNDPTGWVDITDQLR